MSKQTAQTIDADVLLDACKQLESAARRLRAIYQDADDDNDQNKRRLSEATANIHAALARLE